MNITALPTRYPKTEIPAFARVGLKNKEDQSQVEKVLQDVQSARLSRGNPLSYRSNVQHRLVSDLVVTDSNGKETPIKVTWNFAAFNNKTGNVRISIPQKNGADGVGIEIKANEVPDAIKDALVPQLRIKNPTHSHTQAAKDAKPEVDRYAHALYLSKANRQN